jgi:hypothetical protein
MAYIWRKILAITVFQVDPIKSASPNSKRGCVNFSRGA